jgi:adenosylcobinamide amidohydrolase|tara:strand:+ start:334 stop:510 length:177 start_codon:yes stop_codon:yes gene_type:complete
MSRVKTSTLKHPTKAGHKRVNYIISGTVYEAFKRKAESEGKLMSFVVEQGIKNYLKNE